MDRKLLLKLNGARQVTGVLRGYDQFMNLVLDEAEEVNGDERTPAGMVVVRGNSVVLIESLDALPK